jgi:hypothetical protein
VVADGSVEPVLDEPARDYVPSTRPGGRLPHGWLDASVSTLDLVDLAVPTVLVRSDSRIDAPPAPVVVWRVDAAVWDDTFGLAPDVCLLVRPDQHVAYRGPIVDLSDALRQLFPCHDWVRHQSSHEETT